MTSRLSDTQKAEARALYLSDPKLSVDAVAATYGVGRTVMLRVLTGITRPAVRPAKATLSTEEMVELRNNGITLFQIGLMAGITEAGVHHRIKKYNEENAQ